MEKITCSFMIEHNEQPSPPSLRPPPPPALTSLHGLSQFHLKTGFMPLKLAIPCMKTAGLNIPTTPIFTPSTSLLAHCNAVRTPQSSWRGKHPLANA